MRRLLAAAAALTLALVLGGCTMQTDSRLDEFHAQAHRILDDTVALIPAGLVPDDGITKSEPRIERGEGPAGPGDPAWWQSWRGLNLVPQPDASADAAAAITAGLEADGWRASRVRETEEGARIADGFRREVDGEEWYIEVTWVVTRPDMAEVIEVWVISPPTVRGDQAPAT